jgi:6-phosphogluconolactonase
VAVELRVAGNLPAEAVAAFEESAPRDIALAGGTTPEPVYRRLAGLRYPWHEVDAFFTDERCVAPDHPDSNHAMAFRALLSKVAARGHPMHGCDAEGSERELRQHFGEGIPTFDLVFLGLGADGHTASLFPGDPVLEERARLVVRVERPDHPRLTLTLPVLSAARVAVFLVSGEGKREALRRLLEGDPGIPAARVTAERVVVVADPAAAP